MIRSIPLLETTKKDFMSLYRIWGLATICLYQRLFEESSEASLIYLEINAFIDTEHKRFKKETYLLGRMNQTAKNSLFWNCNVVSCSSTRHLSTMEWTEAYAIRFHNFRLDILSSNLSRDINDLSITTHQRLSHFMSCGKIGSRLMYHAEIKRQLAW